MCFSIRFSKCHSFGNRHLSSSPIPIPSWVGAVWLVTCRYTRNTGKHLRPSHWLFFFFIKHFWYFFVFSQSFSKLDQLWTTAADSTLYSIWVAELNPTSFQPNLFTLIRLFHLCHVIRLVGCYKNIYGLHRFSSENSSISAISHLFKAISHLFSHLFWEKISPYMSPHLYQHITKKSDE